MMQLWVRDALSLWRIWRDGIRRELHCSPVYLPLPRHPRQELRACFSKELSLFLKAAYVDIEHWNHRKFLPLGRELKHFLGVPAQLISQIRQSMTNPPMHEGSQSCKFVCIYSHVQKTVIGAVVCVGHPYLSHAQVLSAELRWSAQIAWQVQSGHWGHQRTGRKANLQSSVRWSRRVAQIARRRWHVEPISAEWVGGAEGISQACPSKSFPAVWRQGSTEAAAKWAVQKDRGSSSRVVVQWLAQLALFCFTHWHVAQQRPHTTHDHTISWQVCVAMQKFYVVLLCLLPGNLSSSPVHVLYTISYPFCLA